MGMIDQVVEDVEQLLPLAQQQASKLLNNSPAAMKAAKALYHAVAQRPIDSQLIADTAQRIAQIRVSSEGQEGLTAFLEKRKPSWIQSDNNQ